MGASQSHPIFLAINELLRSKKLEVKRNIHLVYPMFQDPQGGGCEEPLDFKVIGSLAESVRTYGITVSFTVAQVKALTRYCMTPDEKNRYWTRPMWS